MKENQIKSNLLLQFLVPLWMYLVVAEFFKHVYKNVINNG